MSTPSGWGPTRMPRYGHTLRQHGYTIVSKDSDFVELSIVRGAPPKLVWLRVGNCATERAAELLHKHGLEIAALTTDDSLRYCVIE